MNTSTTSPLLWMEMDVGEKEKKTETQDILRRKYSKKNR